MASWRIRFHDKWPHLASLYANTHNLDEEGKYPDPVMGQDNVFDPAEPLGAYRYYLAPSQRSEFSIEEPNYANRSFYKDEESRSSDYTSGDSFRRGSTCRVLLCVFLVFSFIGAVVAAITLAVILSQQTPPKLVPGEPQYYESTATALGETFSKNLTDPNSQQFKSLEEKFCKAIEAMFKSGDSPVKHQFSGCEVIEFSNGSVKVRYRLKLQSGGPDGFKEKDRIEERLLEHFMKKISQTGPWNTIKWDRKSFRRFLKVEVTTESPSTTVISTPVPGNVTTSITATTSTETTKSSSTAAGDILPTSTVEPNVTWELQTTEPPEVVQDSTEVYDKTVVVNQTESAVTWELQTTEPPELVQDSTEGYDKTVVVNETESAVTSELQTTEPPEVVQDSTEGYDKTVVVNETESAVTSELQTTEPPEVVQDSTEGYDKTVVVTQTESAEAIFITKQILTETTGQKENISLSTAAYVTPTSTYESSEMPFWNYTDWEYDSTTSTTIPQIEMVPPDDALIIEKDLFQREILEETIAPHLIVNDTEKINVTKGPLATETIIHSTNITTVEQTTDTFATSVPTFPKIDDSEMIPHVTETLSYYATDTENVTVDTFITTSKSTEKHLYSVPEKITQLTTATETVTTAHLPAERLETTSIAPGSKETVASTVELSTDLLEMTTFTSAEKVEATSVTSADETKPEYTFELSTQPPLTTQAGTEATEEGMISIADSWTTTQVTTERKDTEPVLTSKLTTQHPTEAEALASIVPIVDTSATGFESSTYTNVHKTALVTETEMIEPLVADHLTSEHFTSMQSTTLYDETTVPSDTADKTSMAVSKEAKETTAFMGFELVTKDMHIKASTTEVPITSGKTDDSKHVTYINKTVTTIESAPLSVFISNATTGSYSDETTETKISTESTRPYTEGMWIDENFTSPYDYFTESTTEELTYVTDSTPLQDKISSGVTASQAAEASVFTKDIVTKDDIQTTVSTQKEYFSSTSSQDTPKEGVSSPEIITPSSKEVTFMYTTGTDSVKIASETVKDILTSLSPQAETGTTATHYLENEIKLIEESTDKVTKLGITESEPGAIALSTDGGTSAVDSNATTSTQSLTTILDEKKHSESWLFQTTTHKPVDVTQTADITFDDFSKTSAGTVSAQKETDKTVVVSTDMPHTTTAFKDYSTEEKTATETKLSSLASLKDGQEDVISTESVMTSITTQKVMAETGETDAPSTALKPSETRITTSKSEILKEVKPPFETETVSYAQTDFVETKAFHYTTVSADLASPETRTESPETTLLPLSTPTYKVAKDVFETTTMGAVDSRLISDAAEESSTQPSEATILHDQPSTQATLDVHRDQSMRIVEDMKVLESVSNTTMSVSLQSETTSKLPESSTKETEVYTIKEPDTEKTTKSDITNLLGSLSEIQSSTKRFTQSSTAVETTLSPHYNETTVFEAEYNENATYFDYGNYTDFITSTESETYVEVASPTVTHTPIVPDEIRSQTEATVKETQTLSFSMEMTKQAEKSSFAELHISEAVKKETLPTSPTNASLVTMHEVTTGQIQTTTGELVDTFTETATAQTHADSSATDAEQLTRLKGKFQDAFYTDNLSKADFTTKTTPKSVSEVHTHRPRISAVTSFDITTEEPTNLPTSDASKNSATETVMKPSMINTGVSSVRTTDTGLPQGTALAPAFTTESISLQDVSKAVTDTVPTHGITETTLAFDTLSGVSDATMKSSALPVETNATTESHAISGVTDTMTESHDLSDITGATAESLSLSSVEDATAGASELSGMTGTTAAAPALSGVEDATTYSPALSGMASITTDSPLSSIADATTASPALSRTTDASGESPTLAGIADATTDTSAFSGLTDTTIMSSGGADFTTKPFFVPGLADSVTKTPVLSGMTDSAAEPPAVSSVTNTTAESLLIADTKTELHTLSGVSTASVGVSLPATDSVGPSEVVTVVDARSFVTTTESAGSPVPKTESLGSSTGSLIKGATTETAAIEYYFETTTAESPSEVTDQGDIVTATVLEDQTTIEVNETTTIISSSSPVLSTEVLSSDSNTGVSDSVASAPNVTVAMSEVSNETVTVSKPSATTPSYVSDHVTVDNTVSNMYDFYENETYTYYYDETTTVSSLETASESNDGNKTTSSFNLTNTQKVSDSSSVDNYQEITTTGNEVSSVKIGSTTNEGTV